MNEEKYFRGKIEYFLLEGEDRFLYENGGVNNPLMGKIIEFKEVIWNPIFYRIKYSHNKIELIFEELSIHVREKNKLKIAEVFLEEDILCDAIAASLLEFYEVIKDFSDKINSEIRTEFAELFRRISKNKLKKVHKSLMQSYINARCNLFPDLENDRVNVTSELFASLSNKLIEKLKQLKIFRDKVIAHKFDKDGNGIRLSYQEYYQIYEYIVKMLKDIFIVTTLSPVDDNHFNISPEKIELAKKWIRTGLSGSLLLIPGVSNTRS